MIENLLEREGCRHSFRTHEMNVNTPGLIASKEADLKRSIAMSCCGQKRAAASSMSIHWPRPGNSSPAPRPVPAAARSISLGTGDRRVRYLGATSLSLTGPRSGRVYYFAQSGSTAIVDETDVDALMRTRLFVSDTASPVPGR